MGNVLQFKAKSEKKKKEVKQLAHQVFEKEYRILIEHYKEMTDEIIKVNRDYYDPIVQEYFANDAHFKKIKANPFTFGTDQYYHAKEILGCIIKPKNFNKEFEAILKIWKFICKEHRIRKGSEEKHDFPK